MQVPSSCAVGGCVIPDAFSWIESSREMICPHLGVGIGSSSETGLLFNVNSGLGIRGTSSTWRTLAGSLSPCSCLYPTDQSKHMLEVVSPNPPVSGRGEAGSRSGERNWRDLGRTYPPGWASETRNKKQETSKEVNWRENLSRCAREQTEAPKKRSAGKCCVLQYNMFLPDVRCVCVCAVGCVGGGVDRL